MDFWIFWHLPVQTHPSLTHQTLCMFQNFKASKPQVLFVEISSTALAQWYLCWQSGDDFHKGMSRAQGIRNHEELNQQRTTFQWRVRACPGWMESPKCDEFDVIWQLLCVLFLVRRLKGGGGEWIA